MAARVAARRRLGEALPLLVELRTDDVTRVRRSAERAVARLTSSGA